MSLRDQLLAKGLASKKQARKIERELKAKRRAEQGSRRRQRELERQRIERAEAERQAAEEARRAERAERAERQAIAERALRIRNVLLGNRLRPGQGQRFWHRSPDGTHLSELQVSSGMAYKLRCGEVAIAQLDHRGWSEAVLIPTAAAEKLRKLAPELILFSVEDTSGLSAPELAFHQRDWPTELGPHRATEADLARLRQQLGRGPRP
ncbi:MAG TPA: DUF2058 family protein [Deltaproteobacteria bacterium]|nr:DUF2058 family protein [Deltaproteobacteria bacterium]